MSQNLTEHINYDNVKNVRRLIAKKQSCFPFLATEPQATSAITDMDHFPYTRFYRGNPNSSRPTVFEREAGWRPTNNQCYKALLRPTEEGYPNHCFSSACSTVFPCYPSYQQKFADKEALDIQLNSACIVQYR